jgi:hypothetical protein
MSWRCPPTCQSSHSDFLRYKTVTPFRQRHRRLERGAVKIDIAPLEREHLPNAHPCSKRLPPDQVVDSSATKAQHGGCLVNAEEQLG